MLALVKKPRIELSLHGDDVDELIGWISKKFEVSILSSENSESIAIEETDFWKEMQSNRIGNLLAGARLQREPNKENTMKNNLSDKQSNFLLYTGNDGKVNVGVFVKDETVWLTQKAMSELFGVKIPAISKHLSNIFASKELQKDTTISILETVQKEGNRQINRKMEFYNLDAIISVGYRVNSYEATQFRIWATRTLKEYIIKGFVLDDERLKQGNQVFGRDYAENRAKRQILMKMTDWIEILHNFLELSKYPILQDKGKVNALQTKLKAENEFEEYRVIQDV